MEIGLMSIYAGIGNENILQYLIFNDTAYGL